MYPKKKSSSFSFSIVYGFCLMLLLSGNTGCKAQESASTEGVKSGVIQKIDGKKFYIHTVGKGQTLYSIARIYGLDVNTILLHNPLAIDGIQPDMELRIPQQSNSIPTTPSSTTPNTQTITVEQGQTLYAISRKYQVSTDEILKLNPDAKNGLKTGQLLYLPKKDSAHLTPESTVNTEVIPAEKINLASRVIKNISMLPVNSDSVIRIALFLPFDETAFAGIELDKVIRDEVKMPLKLEISLQFYEGVLVALDSLKRAGISTKLHVFNMDEKDVAKNNRLLSKPELTQMHLFIGPLYTENFAEFSKFALKHNIPIVSPLTTVNKILLNNSMVSKVTPSAFTAMEKMGDYIMSNYANANVLLLNSGNVKDQSYVTTLKNKFKNFKPGGVDSVLELRNTSSLLGKLTRTKVNVVVCPTSQQANVIDLLNKLQAVEEEYTIILFGLSSWGIFDNLDVEYLNKLHVHIPFTTFADFKQPQAKRFFTLYRDKFNGTPENYVVQGYDVTLFYTKLLNLYGKGFQSNLATYTHQGVQNTFQFNQLGSENGFENTHIYLMKLQDYQWMPAGEPLMMNKQ